MECFVHRRYLHFLCQIVADRLSSMSKEVKSESVSLCPLGTAAAPEQEPLCIFGTGDFGRSLGQRLLQSGYKVVYGSRRPHSCGPLPQGAQVMSHAAAAQSASVVILCIHREHYDFLETLAPQLKGKVLVDVSNNLKKNVYPEANAEYLHKLIPGAHVVKALNTLSAWVLQNGPSDASRQVYLCGNNVVAKQTVAEMATKLGFTVLDRGSLTAARAGGLPPAAVPRVEAAPTPGHQPQCLLFHLCGHYRCCLCIC